MNSSVNEPAITSADAIYMAHAMEAARKAASLGEVPVGAIVTYRGYIIGRGYNLRETSQSVIAHAEILALEEAARTLGVWRLDACDLYVTLEPCAMCAGAIQQALIRSVTFAARDPKAGVLISTDRYFLRRGLNHYPSIKEGPFSEASSQLLKSFFKALRASKRST